MHVCMHARLLDLLYRHFRKQVSSPQHILARPTSSLEPESRQVTETDLPLGMTRRLEGTDRNVYFREASQHGFKMSTETAR